MRLAGRDGRFYRGDGVILISAQTGDAQLPLAKLQRVVGNLIKALDEVARREPLG